MTNREFFTAIANTENLSAELKAFATEQIEKLDARNGKRRETLTKEQKANEELKVVILNAIGIGSLTASEVATACGISTQKASALCRLLVNDGKLNAHDVKVKGKGSVKVYEANLVDEGEDEE
jgi:predicted HTH transcriptional regulator